LSSELGKCRSSSVWNGESESPRKGLGGISELLERGGQVSVFSNGFITSLAGSDRVVIAELLVVVRVRIILLRSERRR